MRLLRRLCNTKWRRIEHKKASHWFNGWLFCITTMFGRNGRIWTCDHYTPSVVRYQTALRPEWLTILRKIMHIARAIYFSQNLKSYFTYHSQHNQGAVNLNPVTLSEFGWLAVDWHYRDWLSLLDQLNHWRLFLYRRDTLQPSLGFSQWRLQRWL